MRRLRLIGPILLLASGQACSRAPAPPPAVVQGIIDAGSQTSWMARGDDPWAVVVCHVPTNTQSAVYAGLPLRLAMGAEQLAGILDSEVSPYFETLSHGIYRPSFDAAGEVTIAATDGPQACVDAALTSAGAEVQGVIAIADAEHNANEPGGFANAGDCPTAPCSAATSRRSVYVGAADFSSEWGDHPPMDLVEHELGHALGWPHSGYDATVGEPHRSALDVMSNSAAPRLTDSARRDAPDTLAINRLAARWLPPSAVAVVDAAVPTVTLSPSPGTSGTRLAIAVIGEATLLTVELLEATGFDDHLPASGVAVHLIEGADANRRQTPLVGLAPYDDLLTPGEAFSGSGWRVSVSDGWRVTVQPLDNRPTVSG